MPRFFAEDRRLLESRSDPGRLGRRRSIALHRLLVILLVWSIRLVRVVTRQQSSGFTRKKRTSGRDRPSLSHECPWQLDPLPPKWYGDIFPARKSRTNRWITHRCNDPLARLDAPSERGHETPIGFQLRAPQRSRLSESIARRSRRADTPILEVFRNDLLSKLRRSRISIFDRQIKSRI